MKSAITTTTSESVIGSLCREVEYIRARCINLAETILRCKDELLCLRLQSEFKELQERQNNLLETSREFKKNLGIDVYSLEFLIEICSRKVTAST